MRLSKKSSPSNYIDSLTSDALDEQLNRQTGDGWTDWQTRIREMRKKGGRDVGRKRRMKIFYWYKGSNIFFQNLNSKSFCMVLQIMDPIGIWFNINLEIPISYPTEHHSQEN